MPGGALAKITTEFSHKNKLSLLAIWAPENFDRTIEDVFESDDFAGTELRDLDEQKTLLGVNWRFLASKSSFLQNSQHLQRPGRLWQTTWQNRFGRLSGCRESIRSSQCQ